MENNEKISERKIIKKLAVEVYNGNLSIDELKSEYIDLYLTNKQLFDSAYKLHLNDKVESPKWRMNILFAGNGGLGKTSLANIIAEKLDKDSIFTFTDIEAGFNDYTNQNIVIWDEMRANFIKEWGINRFLTACNNGKYNTAKIRVLYGVAKLGQHYNFITTSEPPKDFLLGMTERSWEDAQHTRLTQPENPDQIARRFPYYIWFTSTQVDKYTKNLVIYFYEYNPIKQDGGTYDFTDKYEIIKSWGITTTEENYETQLEIIADVIVAHMKGKTIDTLQLSLLNNSIK